MIDKICEKSKCTACYACQNACPAEAIELKADEFGNLYPTVNEKCTECGLCKSICPSNKPIKKNEPLKAYAAFSRDEKIRSSSTSGGFIYTAAMKFDGIVYGAAYTEGLNVDCIRIENKNELYKTQSSKYVHSHINLCYRAVKEDLENGKSVLFIGTPCQIAGLKAYLKKDYDALYTIDFVCHGVIERQALKDYIWAEFPKAEKNALTVRFRDDGGYHMTVYENGKYTGEIPFNVNFYYHAFLEGWGLRENCHSCEYADIKRCSDLTACDFWGADDSVLKEEMKRGLNGILVNSEKGAKLLDSVTDFMSVTERNIKETKNGALHLRRPCPETEYSKRFRALYEKHGFNYALKNTVIKKKIAFTLRKMKNAGNSNN